MSIASGNNTIPFDFQAGPNATVVGSWDRIPSSAVAVYVGLARENDTNAVNAVIETSYNADSGIIFTKEIEFPAASTTEYDPNAVQVFALINLAPMNEPADASEVWDMPHSLIFPDIADPGLILSSSSNLPKFRAILPHGGFIRLTAKQNGSLVNRGVVQLSFGNENNFLADPATRFVPS